MQDSFFRANPAHLTIACQRSVELDPIGRDLVESETQSQIDGVPLTLDRLQMAEES